MAGESHHAADVLHPRVATAHTGDDAGSIIAGWLIKLSVVLGIVGVVLMDGISMGTARMNVDQDAHDAAQVVKDANPKTLSYQAMEAVAAASLAKSSPEDRLVPNSIKVAANGNVTVTVTRTADTLVLNRIKPLAKYGEFTVTVTTGTNT